MFNGLNYDGYVSKYFDYVKDKPENTQKRIRNTLSKIETIPKAEVFNILKELENKKLSTRRVLKSTYRKFFEYIDDTEMIDFLESISDDEIESVGDNYFFNVLELKQYIKDKNGVILRNNSQTRRLRTYIYAYLLYIGVRNSDIKSIDIYEFNENEDVIIHNNDVYDIKSMDINNTIHDELLNNKRAKGIDYESGEYVTTTGSSPLVKSLQGTLFMRTAMSPTGGFAANTSLSDKERQLVARSGAFIRFYNLKKNSGLDTKTLFNSLDEDLMRVLNRHAILSEYEEFEKAYKEAGY